MTETKRKPAAKKPAAKKPATKKPAAKKPAAKKKKRGYVPDPGRGVSRPGRGGRTKTSGQGRPKGSKNRLSRNMKEEVLEAYERLGGVDWLVTLGKEDPKAFATLVLRVMPTQAVINAQYEASITVKDERYNETERAARLAHALSGAKNPQLVEMFKRKEFREALGIVDDDAEDVEFIEVDDAE